MPLQKNYIEIPLGGINSKVDPKQLKPGNLLMLENGQFDRVGEIQKRFGYSTLDYSVSADTAKNINGIANSLFVDNNKYMTLADQYSDPSLRQYADGYHLYNTVSADIRSTGRHSPYTISNMQAISRPTAETDMISSATIGGYTVTVWSRVSDTIYKAYMTIINNSTNTRVVTEYNLTGPVVAHTPYFCPKVFAVNGKFVIVIGAGGGAGHGEIKAATIDSASIMTAPSFTSIVTDLSVDGSGNPELYDACVGQDNSYSQCLKVVYKESSVGHIKITHFRETLVQIRSATITEHPIEFLSVQDVYKPSVGTSTYYSCICFKTATTHNVTYCLYDKSAAEYLAPTLIYSHGGMHYQITAMAEKAYYNQFGEDRITFFISRDSTSAVYPEILIYKGSFTGTDVAEICNVPWASLMSKPILLEDRAHVLISVCATTSVFPATDGSTTAYALLALSDVLTASPLYFTYDIGLLFFVGRAAMTFTSYRGPSTASNYSTNGLPSWSSNYLPVLSANTETNTVYIFKLLTSANTNLSYANTQPGLAIAGGLTGYYDNQIQDLGFAQVPVITALAGNDAAPILGMSDGDYYYIAVYEWTDQYGQVHQSAPSLPKLVTLSAGTNTQHVHVSVKPASIGNWQKLINTKIIVYRTINAGQVYYRSNDLADNNPQLDALVVYDNINDADIALNQTLYTTGGVLPNWPIPCSKLIANNQNRLFMVPADNDRTIVFSKVLKEGKGPEFTSSDLFHIKADVGGSITGLAVLDEKIIVFKDSSIYFFTGDGPNDLGGGGFSALTLLSNTIGCTAHTSICQSDHGIFFQSYKGIYLLDHSLNLSFVGVPVTTELSSATIIRAISQRQNNRIVFFLNSGICLVYDYLLNQWSTWTNYNVSCAAQVGSNLVMTSSMDSRYYISNSDFLDYPTASYVPIQLKITTPWIKLSELQGYQRVYWVHLLGSYKTYHNMIVQVAYDYLDTVVETFTLTNDNTTFTYPCPLNKRFMPAKQKCSAIKLTIYDTAQGDEMESFSLSTIGFTIGSKGKFRPLDSARTGK